MRFQATKHHIFIRSKPVKTAAKWPLLLTGLLLVSLGSSPLKAGTIVEYSCNEGIPLIVEFINTSKSSIAIISHDSSPRIALDETASASGAKYTDGNWVLHVKGKTALVGTGGQFDDECQETTAATNTPPPKQALTFPRKAKSWGGIVRKGPGTNYRKAASLKEGEWVTLLERTSEIMNGYPWFKIKYRGKTGYKWGGILCSVGAHVEGTYQICK